MIFFSIKIVGNSRKERWRRVTGWSSWIRVI